MRREEMLWWWWWRRNVVVVVVVVVAQSGWWWCVELGLARWWWCVGFSHEIVEGERKRERREREGGRAHRRYRNKISISASRAALVVKSATLPSEGMRLLKKRSPSQGEGLRFF